MADEQPATAERPPVRTFHARSGRLSPAKRRLLDEVLPRYTLGPDERPAALDFGCGSGEALLAGAADQPDRLWLGVDVHRATLAGTARTLVASGVPNVRLHLGDGVDLLSRRIDVDSLQLAQILFPDPWPKAAHRHRRLIQAPFVALLVSRLTVGAHLELATDHLDYAAQMTEVLDACDGLRRTPLGEASPPPVPSPTFYERRARAEGRPVIHLHYTRAGAR